MTPRTDIFSIADLPDTARIWIYVADRDLDEREENRVAEILTNFCATWESHGRPVESAAEVLGGRFAVIAGRIVDGDVSGCGIDKSIHALQIAADELGLHWLPGLLVHYRDKNGVIHSVPRSEFRKLVAGDVVTAETPVFDLSIETLEHLRGGRFERPAGETWHNRVFHISPSGS